MSRHRLIAFGAFAASALVAVWAGAIGAPANWYKSFNKADTEITDVHTGLVWKRAPSPTTLTYADAQIYCAGYRLPTYKELLTLVDEDPHYEYDPDSGTTSLRYIDPNAFPSTLPAPFWSLSDDNNAGSPNKKVVDFGDGTTGHRDGANDLAYARCVR